MNSRFGVNCGSCFESSMVDIIGQSACGSKLYEGVILEISFSSARNKASGLTGHLVAIFLTLSAHAQRVTVVVESVCLSVCLSVTPN